MCSTLPSVAYTAVCQRKLLFPIRVIPQLVLGFLRWQFLFPRTQLLCFMLWLLYTIWHSCNCGTVLSITYTGTVDWWGSERSFASRMTSAIKACLPRHRSHLALQLFFKHSPIPTDQYSQQHEALQYRWCNTVAVNISAQPQSGSSHSLARTLLWTVDLSISVLAHSI